MANLTFTSPSAPTNSASFTGGLNSTAGPLALGDNESSDLQNVDFNKFGSVMKRNGYLNLNANAATGTSDGLHWFEYDNAGTLTREAIRVLGGGVAKMDALDGTWDAVTSSSPTTITAGYHCGFTNFLNCANITNGKDLPFKYDGTNYSVLGTFTDLETACYNEEFNNYLFIANVTVGGVKHASRIYWFDIKSNSTIDAANFIDVAKNDGQEIRGIKKLSDRLVVYKDRSIYNVQFTGDADIPFILPGGGKSNSTVGCIAPYSIQEVENGQVFLSYDGIYYYDGLNSYKISDKITATLDGYTKASFPVAVSLVQKNKNRYWLSLPSGGSLNNRLVVWDYFNNAFSLYAGLKCSSMATFHVDGIDERPYFDDYNGFTYRADTGEDDYPLKVKTAISAYYWTNWRHFGDLVDQKGIPSVYIYYNTSNSVLGLSYSYDFELASQYTQSFSLSAGTDVYGVGKYGTAVYSGSGGMVKRRDLTGRGRVIRFKFSNSTVGETLRIDGLGTMPHLETNV